MPSIIENELRKRCQIKPELGILLAQWEYDSRLFGRALNTIGYTFPHYSLHDSSHSETILQRVGSILGTEAISHLSATDLWLLLEAAYLHDIGMVVIDSAKRDELNSEDFKIHIKSLTEHSDPELSKAAQRIHANQARHTPSDILDGQLDLLIVYAEFVRARHPTRAYETAVNPSKQSLVPSPRTWLLPNRFWHTIGTICKAHGETRSQAMSLPYRESGVGGEVCHPRFAAFMLRLGDLLDLDSGRFCSTMNSTIASMPPVSIAHRQKHDGIRHFLVDKSRIEVTGIYQNTEPYLEAERWFGWLKEELGEQLLSWDRIAPSEQIGPLPSLGKIEAQLENQIIYDKTIGPRFGIDREKVLELVRGANIYSGPEDAVREIIQNSIDATLLKISYDLQSRRAEKPQNIKSLRKLLEAYPIFVSVGNPRKKSQDASAISLQIKVIDHGIGMREDDIKHLTQLGSSSRNTYKRRLSDWMPEWARPSGTFGIGLHSIFEYCDRVTITTRHPEDTSAIVIELETRQSEADPIIIIKRQRRINTEFPRPSGTEISATLQTEEYDSPSYFERRDGHAQKTKQVMWDYDYITKDQFSFVHAEIQDTVASMATDSLCSIFLNDERHSSNVATDALGACERIFHPDTNIEIKLIDTSDQPARQNMVKYRGAEVPHAKAHLVPLLSIDVDLHFGNARDILTLSRNDLTTTGNRLLVDSVKTALPHCINHWLPDLRSRSASQKELASLSLFAALYGPETIAGSEWRDATVPDNIRRIIGEPSTVNFGQLSDATTATIAFIDHIIPSAAIKLKKISSEGDRIDLRSFNWYSHDTMVICDFLKKHFSSILIDLETDSPDSSLSWPIYIFTKTRTAIDVSNEAMAYFLQNRTMIESKQTSGPDLLFGRRSVMPCAEKYKILSIPDMTHVPGNHHSDFLMLKVPIMANPFVGNATSGVLIEQPIAYIQWLAKNTGRNTRDIAMSLIDFIESADSIMAEKWATLKRYNTGDVKAKITTSLIRK